MSDESDEEEKEEEEEEDDEGMEGVLFFFDQLAILKEKRLKELVKGLGEKEKEGFDWMEMETQKGFVKG